MKNYYKILEVEPTATIEQIKSQHRLLLHAWHPDKFPNAELKAKAEERVKEINEAYSIISDPTEREIYDRKLRSYDSPPPPPVQQQTPPKRPTVKPKPTCDCCSMPAQLKYVEFYENVGMVFMRQHRSIKGKLCKSCIDYCFWNLTGKTMLLGWWGMISFFITPFILLNNIFRYISTVNMRKPVINITPSPSSFWIFTSISGFLLLSYIAFSIVFPESAQSTSPSLKFVPTNTPIPPAPTRIVPTAIKTPTSSASNCIKWTQITPGMIGYKICVYGNVYAIYDTDKTATRLKFSPEPNTFFMYDVNFVYPDLKAGDCVLANEVLQLYGDIPYISVSSLYKCESWMK